MEMFSVKNLNKVEGKEKYCIEVSNTLLTLEDMDTEVQINIAWETIRENITIQPKRD
jgi:hypothetical protein